MVEFVFGPEDVARVRFAFSPNWELVSSVRALRRPSAHALHLPWAEEAIRALRGFDMSLLLALIPPEGYVPDFLRPLLERPRKGLRTLTDALTAYWERTLDHHWPRLRSLLQGEVLHRARQFTVGGSELLFHDLHDDVRWDGERLRVGIRYDADIPLEGRGLLMLPSAFYWPRVAVVTDPAWQPSLTYPPRGVATLWDPDEPRGPDGLEALIGTTRAAILAELETPRSTTELARRLNLTPGAVSQHLRRLSRGRVVTGSREGREVLYALTGAGEALLSGARPPRA